MPTKKVTNVRPKSFSKEVGPHFGCAGTVEYHVHGGQGWRICSSCGQDSRKGASPVVAIPVVCPRCKGQFNMQDWMNQDTCPYCEKVVFREKS